MTTSLVKVDDVAEVQKLLESPLTSHESQELEACELQIEIAGKDRLEKALIIGEKLSTIYNHALFRGDGGRTWADWVEQRLPQLLPHEAPKLGAADHRRILWEARHLLSGQTSDREHLPVSNAQAEALQGLIPRAYNLPQGGWNPVVFDDPECIEGLSAVWGLAQRNAAQNQRKNGPTANDVKEAREELRPQLLEKGWIREAPKAFQQSTADRMAAAAASRQTVTAETAEQRAERQRVLDEAMAQVKASAPERAQQAKFNQVREELERPERERQQDLEDKVRQYNSKLISCYESIHDLLVFMQTLDRVDGTQYLQDMREIDVAGLITVRDDLPRLKGFGEELVQIVQLANSCNPPSGIDMTTVNVEAGN